MVWTWEPGTQYDYGYVVQYEGVKYKIIQPHRSQADWTPPITPALWQRLPDDHVHEEHPAPEKCDTYDKPSYQPQSSHPNQNVQIDQEERKKNWYDLDDNRKKELEIGGGLLAGAAALGAGYFAYNHHKKSEEDKKAVAWALQNWIHDAEVRTNQYRSGQWNSPVGWVLNHGRDIPSDAIQAGEEKGNVLYIARAFQDGGLQIGKASGWFKQGAVIGYKNEEIQLETFEVLVGDARAVRWVDGSGTFSTENLDGKPVEGGHENNNTPLFIAQAPYKGGVHPGKIANDLDGAVIPYDNGEVKVKEYRVLCYA